VAGRVELAEFDDLRGRTPSRWLGRRLFIGDPDHFRIGAHDPFERINPPRLNDIPCDPDNPLQVQAKFATLRGVLARNAKDWKTALCWFRIAAGEDDSGAQFALALYLEQGRGGAIALAQAFSWFKRSADGGNFRGAAELERMYRNGIGVPQDAAQADAWRLRVQALQAQENNDILVVQEGEKKEERDMNVMLGFGALLGAVILGDVKPEPCKIVDSYAGRDYLSQAESDELAAARREIREQNIICP
jgi:hypothetical protein